jgi:hypothetical protein
VVTIIQLIIIAIILVVGVLAVLDSWGVLSLFGVPRTFLRERHAERLAADARRELAQRDGVDR